jgi:hypothetical protein
MKVYTVPLHGHGLTDGPAHHSRSPISHAPLNSGLEKYEARLGFQPDGNFVPWASDVSRPS